ncbi:MAG: hypothetical protein U0V74_07780 [Chitinophagales bacterium]
MKKHTFLPFLFALVLLLFTSASSCKKDNDPNALGGDTNIALTQKDSVTSIYIEADGQTLPSTTVKVVSNNNGMVTYQTTIDLLGVPDSILTELVTVLPALYNFYKPKDFTYQLTPDGKIQAQFTVKITSEGMQDFFVEGKPFIAVKYDDAQGTSYNVKMDDGTTITRTITEKTGVDDWPYGFYYIKTSKIETICPAADPVMQKITYRANHKFGLVYVEVLLKNGKVLRTDIFPWFLL